MGLGRLAREENAAVRGPCPLQLPFEEAWYRERGVAAHYVGHPYFDELPDQSTRPGLHGRAGTGGRKRSSALLPGSRTQEVERNLGTMLRAAARTHAARPDTRFLVACYKEAHRAMVLRRLEGYRLPIEAHVGRTPEIIRLAHACVAVSGSVGLELLYHGKPDVRALPDSAVRPAA